ncbi:hypothetical protein EIMP300_30290 [Escherichia coli]|uniref:Cell division protein FtsB n=1 Tax=Escherichia coli TaxID=562 RepID=A0A8S0FP25_ECOLX|nr:hypothetical protein EIMP300_30290 [Escherichia coli]
MGKLTLLLLAILVWLQYSLWFGKNGIHDYTRVNNDVAEPRTASYKRET